MLFSSLVLEIGHFSGGVSWEVWPMEGKQIAMPLNPACVYQEAGTGADIIVALIGRRYPAKYIAVAFQLRGNLCFQPRSRRINIPIFNASSTSPPSRNGDRRSERHEDYRSYRFGDRILQPNSIARFDVAFNKDPEQKLSILVVVRLADVGCVCFCGPKASHRKHQSCCTQPIRTKPLMPLTSKS